MTMENAGRLINRFFLHGMMDSKWPLPTTFTLNLIDANQINIIDLNDDDDRRVYNITRNSGVQHCSNKH